MVTAISGTTNIDEEAFTSLERTGRMLNVSRTTVYQLLTINGGPIQSVKIGKSRKVVMESLRAYMEQLMDEAIALEKDMEPQC